MSTILVVCHGRPVDDHGRPYGQRCRNRFRPPKLVAPRWVMADPPSSFATRPPEPSQVAEIAEAKGWLITPWRDCGCPDHEPGDLHGTCPSCRRPAHEVLALVREVARRGRA